MTWYQAFYGSWNDRDGVRQLRGTYSRKEAISVAKQAANEHGVTVTVRAEDGTRIRFIEVQPERQ